MVEGERPLLILRRIQSYDPDDFTVHEAGGDQSVGRNHAPHAASTAMHEATSYWSASVRIVWDGLTAAS
jgi:hypothetical protein